MSHIFFIYYVTAKNYLSQKQGLREKMFILKLMEFSITKSELSQWEQSDKWSLQRCRISWTDKESLFTYILRDKYFWQNNIRAALVIFATYEEIYCVLCRAKKVKGSRYISFLTLWVKGREICRFSFLKGNVRNHVAFTFLGVEWGVFWVRLFFSFVCFTLFS